MATEKTTGKLAYTVAEFCDAVGIRATKFYELVKTGEIKPRKLGKKTLVTYDEAQRFIKNLDSMAA